MTPHATIQRARHTARELDRAIAPMGVSVGSRLNPPLRAPHYVARPRLTAALRQLEDFPLVLVLAGAGWGKTALLAEWVQARGVPTAWLSIESADNRPPRFWSAVGEALRLAGFVSDAEPFAVLPHQAVNQGAFVEALCAALPGPGLGPCWLVIDDAHLLTDRTVLAELDSVVQTCSSRLRLLLACRGDLPLPLHRYRQDGRTGELTAAQLAMTRAECRALFAARGVSLSRADLTVLTSRTEGWVAGMCLSAMDVSSTCLPARHLSPLVLDQSSAGRYLTDEVLTHLSPRVRRLLIQTSFLDRVSGPLAAALTGIGSARQILHDLARSNSFVIPVDHEGEVFRYHHVFAETLRCYLQREPADLRRRLRSRASDWFAKNGDALSACRLAVDSGEDLSRLPLAELGTVGREPADPELQLAAAATAVLGGADVSAKLRAALASVCRARLSPTMVVTADLIAYVGAERVGSVDKVDEIASRLLAELDSSRPVVALARPDNRALGAAIRLGQARTRFWQNRRLDEVDAIACAARDAAAGEPAIEVQCLDLLQLSAAVHGLPVMAQELDRRSRDVARDGGQPDASMVRRLAQGYLAFLRGDLHKAHHLLEHSHEGDRPATAAAALLRVWVTMAAGRTADAAQLLRREALLADPRAERIRVGVRAAAAELDLRLHRPRAALRKIAASGESLDPMLALSAARAELDLGESGAAGDRLRPLLLDLDQPMPVPLLLQVLLVAAAIADAEGREDEAVAQVLRAIELAPEEVVLPFMAERSRLDDLLNRRPELRRVWPGQRVVSLPLPPQVTLVRPLADPLTDREVAILRRLATTMTTAEIADELYVSVNTVKTHIAAIYRKLPASSRRGAVKRARQLELL